MTIYTRGGDKGETGLPGSRRKAKTDAIFELLGSLDTTNAALGLALANLKKEPLAASTQTLLDDWIVGIQRDLLSVGACIASEKPTEAVILTKLPERTEKFEQQIDHWEAELPELKNFILPGGAVAGATVHLARTLARQTERAFHRLPNAEVLESISVYLNRLSDFLFQMARFINFQLRMSDQIWKQD